MIKVEFECNGRVIVSCEMRGVPLPRIGETICIKQLNYQRFKVIDVVYLMSDETNPPLINIVIERIM